MNLILLEEAQRARARGDEAADSAGLFRLEGSQAKHVREVLRSKPGDTIEVGLLEGPLGKGRVISDDDTSAHLA